MILFWSARSATSGALLNSRMTVSGRITKTIDRGGFYETAGCLRDVIQNHLFQIVALLAMEPPAVRDFSAVHNEKAKSSGPCAR
jgi:glucose-6-phosphate 1-dehydrogenase